MLIDHRPLGYPDLDKADFIDAITAQSDIPAVWLTQTLHATTTTAYMQRPLPWGYRNA